MFIVYKKKFTQGSNVMYSTQWERQASFKKEEQAYNYIENEKKRRKKWLKTQAKTNMMKNNEVKFQYREEK